MILVGIGVVFFYLITGIYTLQIKQGGYYSARANSQYQLAGFLEPHRGTIYITDKNNTLIPAATNKSYPIIFAVPREVKDKDALIRTIQKAIELNNKENVNTIESNLLKEKLSNKKSLYVPLIKQATREQVEYIKKSGVSGIFIDEQERRYYPFENLAAHVIGFVGLEGESEKYEGKYGIERVYQKKLDGSPGHIEGDTITRPRQGTDIALTIDRNIQSKAEEIIGLAVKEHGAESGMVIVQRPTTGDILALASYPNFNPNNYGAYPLDSFIDRSIQTIFEPGSTMKIITIASGLDAGVITPDTTYIDNGSLVLNGRTIRNWDLSAHGKVDMRYVIAHSLNTGSAFVGLKLGRENMDAYLNTFGFNEPTGIQLSDEIVGNIKNIKKKEEINLATASFGQGVSVTPMAMINAISTIANKGVRMKPNIIKGEGNKKIRRVVSEKTAEQVTHMMVRSVDEAELAHIKNYTVAGKTGTAQIPDFRKGGYSDQIINSYVGFAPASDPQFIIFIRVDKPKNNPLAGQVVVTPFRELSEFILNYYNIPPDNLKK